MIRLENLTKRLANRSLFADLTYHFPAGEKIALVGANGAGKTTLLNVITRQDEADSGSIIMPSQLSLGYLPQEPNPQPRSTVIDECETGAAHLAKLQQTMERELALMADDPTPERCHAYETLEAEFRVRGGYSVRSRAEAILAGLGFTPAQCQQSPLELSGGWRMRLELAKIFLRDPDFLVLDEPTNHLDLPSLVWVEKYLEGFRGTLLFVSHDRALLNRLARMTLHLANGRLTPYAGNFDAFLEECARRQEETAARLGQLARQREHMERFVERFGAKATKARQAQSRVKRIEKLQTLEQELAGDGNSQSIHFTLPAPPKSGREVLTLKELAIGYQRPLAKDIKLKMESGWKVAVIGANGIGKSTLLKTIMGKVSALAGQANLGLNVSTAYFAQDQLEVFQPQDTLLATVLKASARVGEREARSVLGSFLFRDNDVFKDVRVLSGGEKSRLGLACLLLQDANFLLLDEPTNHLDMTSVEVLAEALTEYTGTILFVSHDREFIDGVATHIFAMLPDGRSMLFEGDLADYARLAKLAGFPNVLEPDGESLRRTGDAATATVGTGVALSQAVPSQDEFKELKRERARLDKRKNELEALQERARRQIGELEHAFTTTAPSDFQRLGAMDKDLSAARLQLEAAEEEWLSVAEQLEVVEARLREIGRI